MESRAAAGALKSRVNISKVSAEYRRVLKSLEGHRLWFRWTVVLDSWVTNLAKN